MLSVYDAVKSLRDTLFHFDINERQGSLDLCVREAILMRNNIHKNLRKPFLTGY